jgi:hypothetical protein
MRLSNYALAFSIVTGVAASVFANGCSSPDPNSLTADTQSSAEDLRLRCHQREEEVRSQCAVTCMPWGEDDEGANHISKGCDAGAPAAPPPPPPAAPPPPPPPPVAVTCTSFTYSAWSACAGGTQTRTVVSSSPAGCSGGAPVLSQACVAPLDGAALYTTYCSNCHGNGKKGKSASAIQNAINGNVGGMGSLSTLTAAQVAAISAAP